jgi:hypothetical protein
MESKEAKVMIICHSEQSEESRQISIFQILHGVYPEPKVETLRFTQGDNGEGFRMTKRAFLRDHRNSTKKIY